jgi:hypothetical protein
MSNSITPEHIQYLYCAICMECQDLKQPELAITIVNGHAVCDDHRKRANYGFNSIVAGSRKYLTNGPRNGGRSDRRES